MIKSWKHKGLREFYITGSTAGIQAKHKKILRFLLFQLTNAIAPEDMDTPGNGFHKLKGKYKNCFSVKVNANWRLIFRFLGENAEQVDYIDYH